MTDPLRKAAEGLLYELDQFGADQSRNMPFVEAREALRQALQPTDAGGEEPVYVPWVGKAINPLPDPLATAINRYAGPGRELFEMMLAEIRKR